MKVLLVGAGGIGSFFAEAVEQAWMAGLIEPDVEFTVCDYDVVEPKNVGPQNFGVDDVGINKAVALAKRYKVWKAEDIGMGKTYHADEIVSGLADDKDCIILAIDNVRGRARMFARCHYGNKQFIDMRAEGRTAFVMPKGASLEEDLMTLDLADKKSGSCQVENQPIEFGNRVAAMVGLQQFMNLLRGRENRKFVVRL